MNCFICGGVASHTCLVGNERTSLAVCQAQTCRRQATQQIQLLGPPLGGAALVALDDAALVARIAELERRIVALEMRGSVAPLPASAAAAPASATKAEPKRPIAVIWNAQTELEMRRLVAILDFPVSSDQLQSVRRADLQRGQRSILVIRPVGNRVPSLSNANDDIAKIKDATGYAPLVVVLILMTPAPPHTRMDYWDEDRLIGAAGVVRVEVILTRQDDEKPMRWLYDSKATLRRFIESGGTTV